MTATDARKNIILGGGLAGLSAAYHSGFPVYEASAAPGGTAASVNSQGFVFDLGIHILHSKDTYFLELLEKLEVKLVTHQRSGWIFSHNKFFPYPFQVNTSHLPFLTRLQCILGFLASRINKKTPRNYQEWMVNNFGRGFAEIILTPYARKFWGVSPQDMTYEWAGNRVPRPSFSEVVKGAFKDQDTALGTHVSFQYPSNLGQGFGAIANALAAKVKEIHYGLKATAIELAERAVLFDHGQLRVNYHRMISTLPLPELLKLLPGEMVPAEITAAAKALKYNSIAVVNLGVDHPAISEKHWIHFPEPHISFFRISFPKNFAAGLAPSRNSAIQAEVSYMSVTQPDPERLLAEVKQDLVKVGVLAADTRVIFEEVVFLPYGYVIYDHDRESAVAAIHQFLQKFNIYPCGRYGDWEYLWSDQAILSGKKAAESCLEADDGKCKNQAPRNRPDE